jgi:2',3'-cyclic-nucleotide 2'-phosphodiesterase (5'-nucleotidase family)
MLRRLLVALLLSLAVTVSAWAEPVRVTFLHISDLDSMQPDAERGGGVAEVMTVLARERAAAAHSLTTFGGDLISPSLMSGLDQGAHMVTLMNAIGVDVAVPGNHEFDFGAEVAATRMGEAAFPWVVSNITDADGAVFGGGAATWMVEVAGIKLGFIGITTPQTPVVSSPGDALAFATVHEAVPPAVAALKAEGAAFIIALTHQTFAEDLALLQDNLDVRVVLGGHDHTALSYYDGRAVVMKAASQGRFVAALTLVLDRDSKDRLTMRPEMRLISTVGEAPEPQIAARVQGYLDTLDTELGTAIAEIERPLDTTRPMVRGAENAFGNLVATALRHAMDADVALVNGGGIRADRTYAAGDTLTRKDVLAELPFQNVGTLLRVSGAQLRAALENGVSQVEEKAGRFPHVAGMTLAYNPDLPAGKRVVDVQVGGKQLDDAASYTLATNDYLARGGDGYAMFKDAAVLIDPYASKLLSEIVIDHVVANGLDAAAVDGRMTVTDASN